MRRMHDQESRANRAEDVHHQVAVSTRDEMTRLYERRILEVVQTSICCTVVVRKLEQGVPSPRHKLGRSRIRRSAIPTSSILYTWQRQTASTHPQHKPEASHCESSTSPPRSALKIKPSPHPHRIHEQAVATSLARCGPASTLRPPAYSDTTSQHPL